MQPTVFAHSSIMANRVGSPNFPLWKIVRKSCLLDKLLHKMQKLEL